MQIALRDDIISKYGYTLEEVLILLTLETKVNIQECITKLEEEGRIGTVYNSNDKFLLRQTKEELTTIIIESEKCIVPDEKLTNLAKQLKEIFPKGLKDGTALYWAEGITLIVRRLKMFIRKYNIEYTDEQILDAAKRYVEMFNGEYAYMQVLKYFICKDKISVDGTIENESQLINFIENKGQENLKKSWTSNLI